MSTPDLSTVARLLEHKGANAYTIDPLESVHEAVRLMHEHGVGALLVTLEDHLVGIVSERDYVRKVVLDLRASKETKVAEIMTRDLITVAPEDTSARCVALMKKHHIRHLPVVEDGKIRGILSLRDLFIQYVTEEADDEA